jgi:4-oxalomesaconate hydratase
MCNKKPKVMIVSAHAADFCSRAGGTIINYVKNGSNVRVIDLTYGERGESNSLWRTRKNISLEDVKKIREAEAKNAAQILGADIRFMNFDDNPIVIDIDRYQKLVDELREFQPRILLTHWLEDPLNPDHVTTAQSMLHSCVKATDPELGTSGITYPEIFLFEPSVPTNELSNYRPNTYIDITEVFESKLMALRELKTQADLPVVYTQLAEFRARQAVVRHDVHGTLGKRNIKYAEAFKRFTPWTGIFFPLSLEGC